MLTHLSIRNYVLIEEMEIDFSTGLTVLTGETGSGKSIILGGLGLILGDRADASSIKSDSQKCVIEGWFQVDGYGLEEKFREFDLDYEPVSTFRREITSNGKSRAFVNDTPVTLPVLKELSGFLVDIHSQHETMQLNGLEFQLRIIDDVASAEEELKIYREKYHTYRQLSQRLEELLSEEQKLRTDEDYLSFQLKELSEIDLDNISQAEMEEELTILQNTEEISHQVNTALQALSDDEVNALALLTSAKNALGKISNLGLRYRELEDRIQSSLIELKDIVSEGADLINNSVPDQGRINELTQTLDKLYRLQQKHGFNSAEELARFRNEIAIKLEKLGSFGEEIAQVKKDLEIAHNNLKIAGERLSTKRKNSTPELEKIIQDHLAALAMPSAELKIQFSSIPPIATGMDAVNFLFRANKGGKFAEIKKAASGGELSRLMLALKAVMASKRGMPTLIFDEIDAGISGEVANKMGAILHQMARNRQLLCITHLPQIAARGEHHIKVSKKEVDGITHTLLHSLDQEARIKEIAQMLSGENISEAALTNARELLKA